MPDSLKASEGSTARFRANRPAAMELRVALDDFGARALRDEAARQGVEAEDIAAYAVAYYLADLDSGRVTRDVPPSAGR